MQNILPACTRYQRSAYGQRSWFTKLVPLVPHLLVTVVVVQEVVEIQNRLARKSTGSDVYGKHVHVCLHVSLNIDKKE